MTAKDKRRLRIKRGIRKKIYGTPERPRLTVFRSNTSIYAQIVNDDEGKTLASASSRLKALAELRGPKTQISEAVGRLLAERAKAVGISKVVFDRNGYKYHGRVKALAEGARAGGLEF
ncbi:MAG: 50S ribosomal protein L18 [Bacteroidia bacterium]|nr:50S ribosomal protein L18 [Bacteroidia bacterium]